MKIKNTTILLASLLLVSVPFACNDFGDLNENPNAPDGSVNYNFQEAALGSIFRSSIPAIEGDDEQRVKSLMVDFYAQMLDGGNFDTRYYGMIDDWNARMFRRVQTGIANMNLVLRGIPELANPEQYSNAVAVAMIWRVWVASNGVDWFGPIPFANYEGEVVENPPYLSEKEIYYQFFEELEKANTLLKSGNTKPPFANAKYDVIFGNDIEKWRKFGNSLRLRLAMRLTEVDGEKAKEEAIKAVDAGVMAGSADNAKLPPKSDGTWGSNYNYTMFQISWGGPLNMTTTMEKLLSGIGGIPFPEGIVNERSGVALSDVHPEVVDPRGPKMFDPAFETGNWKGRPDGLNVSRDTVTYKPSLHQSVDFAELAFLQNGASMNQTRPYDLFLYEEVCFLRAEAALRGYIALDAGDLYEEGVRASFATWGVSDQVETYLESTEKNLAGTSANFDDNTGDLMTTDAGKGNTKLEKIITQKYLALFPDMSQEAWNDKRRLNLPRTDVALHRYAAVWPTQSTDIKDVNNFIKRVQYPAIEVQGNADQYSKAVQMLGGTDQVNTRIWWDTGKSYLTSEN